MAGTTGRALLRASTDLLRQDREMVRLTIYSALLIPLTLVPITVLYVIAAQLLSPDAVQVVGFVLGLLGAVASTCVAVHFQVATVWAANERIEGRDPDLVGALVFARSRRRLVLRWGATTGTVGFLLSRFAERGIGARIAASFLSASWSVLSFFVVPAIVLEELEIGDALTRSRTLIARRWGKVARTQIPLAFAVLGAYVVCAVGFVAGLFIAMNDGLAVDAFGTIEAIGSIIMFLSVIAMIVVAVISSTINMYARLVLYRFAADLPIPGIDPAVVRGALQSSN